MQELPWRGAGMTQMISAVAHRGERPSPAPSALPSLALALMEACWAAAAEDRPEFREVAAELRSIGAPPAPARRRAQFQTIQAM